MREKPKPQERAIDPEKPMCLERATRAEKPIEQERAILGNFRTIVVDPPWPYRQRLESPRTRGGVKYPTMTVEGIGAIPVGQWADRDCQLWLWTTNSHLHQAFHVLETWGFRYITTATWIKTSYGLGYWLRGQTEHVLLAVRGNPRGFLKGPHGAAEHGWSTLIHAPRGKHSQKPETFYDMVEEIGEPPRLDLFARRQRLGWACWGDELGVKLEEGGKGESQGDSGEQGPLGGGALSVAPGHP